MIFCCLQGVLTIPTGETGLLADGGTLGRVGVAVDVLAVLLGGELDDKVGVRRAEKIGGLEVTGLNNSYGDRTRGHLLALALL